MTHAIACRVKEGMPLAILAAVLLAPGTVPQVRPVYSAIESYTAGAKMICVGKIAKIEDVMIDAYSAVELTIEVTDTMKGQPRKTITAHRYGKDDRIEYEAAQKAGVDFVWFVPKDTARTEFSLEPAFSEYRTLGGLAIGMDYTVLRTRQEVLTRIRKFLKENPGAKGGASLLTPLPGQSLTACVDFNIPLCPWTEKLAVRMITKPESFTFGPPTGNPYDPASEPIWKKSKEGMLRVLGLTLLQHFPSTSNIRLAKRCLNDDSIAMKQKYGEPITAHYWVRDAAFRLLAHWNVEVDPPVVDGPQMAYSQGLFTSDPFGLERAFREH